MHSEGCKSPPCSEELSWKKGISVLFIWDFFSSCILQGCKTPKPFPPKRFSRALSCSGPGNFSAGAVQGLQWELENGSEEIPSALPCPSCSPAPLLQCTKLITGGLRANEPINCFFCGFLSGFIRFIGAPCVQPGCSRSWGKVQAAANFVICAISCWIFHCTGDMTNSTGFIWDFWSYLALCRALGTASSSPSSSSWLIYQAGEGQRAARIQLC